MRGPDSLAAVWVPALRDGMTAAGVPPMGADDVCMTFYGDLYRAAGKAAGTGWPPTWTRRFGRQVPQSHGLAVANAVFHDGLLVKPSAPVTATGRVRSCSGTSTTLPSPSPGSRTRSACGAR